MKSFKHLNKFKRILVTGCQRSGTRIGSKIISGDTGYEYIDEVDFRVMDINKFQVLMALENIVVHCPAAMAFIHNFGDDDTLIVVMKRDKDNIRRSMQRIRWDGEIMERRLYGNKQGDIVDIKYEVWEEQKEQIKNYIEVEYESLSDHKLFIPKDKRKSFAWNQTK